MYIKRQDMLDALWERAEEISDALCDKLIYLPSADVVERKRGKWRHYEGMLFCSECKTEFYDDIMEYCGDSVPTFCPNCGADMRGAE